MFWESRQSRIAREAADPQARVNKYEAATTAVIEQLGTFLAEWRSSSRDLCLRAERTDGGWNGRAYNRLVTRSRDMDMTAHFRFLIDTNVFIPVEPTATEHVEALTAPIADLERLIHETRNELLVHPELYRDIGRDRDPERRHLRLVLANKYARLRRPPAVSVVEPVLGVVDPSSHHWIDHHLLAALAGGAVDFLVTEDSGIHRKAAQLGLEDRVLTVADALEMVLRLYVAVPPALPAVRKVDGRGLDPRDPVFASIRRDYEGFDAWLEKVRAENRAAWIIDGSSGGYGGVCIVKDESPGTYGMYGSVLKVCTFKVSDAHEGYRYGELLLKALFDYAEANSHDWLYLTVLPEPDKQYLIGYVKEFGFEYRGRTENDRELVLVKPRRFTESDLASLSPLAFHVKFGPPAVKWEGCGAFIVPIRPEFHDRLFPEADPQMNLFSGSEPHGNAIRKAYLSKANISLLQPGDLLYFYESRGGLGVTTAGVVEEVFSLSDPQGIVRAVGKRTLYSFDEIVKLAAEASAGVLAVNFRQAKVLDGPVGLSQLVANGVVAAAPQSIQTVPKEGARWLAIRTFQ